MCRFRVNGRPILDISHHFQNVPVSCERGLNLCYLGIPHDAIKKNSSLALLLTQYGGHIGFIDGFFVRSQSLVEKSFMQFSKMVLERQSQAAS